MKMLAWTTVALALASSALAQGGISGSDGSDGAITVEANQVVEIDLNDHPDGVFKATTVSVAYTGTLQFKPNPANTPVRILATGAVSISGYVNVRGQSFPGATAGQPGPGGFGGGAAGDGLRAPGAGQGPGGGRGGKPEYDGDLANRVGSGAHGCPLDRATRPNHGQTYGNALMTRLVGGSGGGGDTAGHAGCGGGGALLIASDESITFGGSGSIDARGGDCGFGSGDGSGGAIRLVAPTISGTGYLDVRGIGESGHGRIRVDAFDKRSYFPTVHQPCTYTSGTFVVVDPPLVGTLRFTHVAGTDIADEATGPIFVQTPPGSPATQRVSVRATGFVGTVPIEIQLTPDYGAPVVQQAEIVMSGATTTIDVNLPFPVNQMVRVDAWTR